MASLIMHYLWIFLALPFESSGDILRGLEIPQYAFDGGSATLSCSYDLRTTGLYSLKWYHNNTEFYRFVPTERDQPINIGPTHKFFLREVARTDNRNILSLSQLTLNASGEYRCELIAEHPSFRTETLKSTMTVLKEHLQPPLIEGVKKSYEPEDIIQVTCRPQKPTVSGLRPSIKWYLNSQMVGPERLADYNYSYRENRSQLTLRIPSSEVINAGGVMTAECRLILGNHQQKSHRILRARTPYSSYLNNFYSKGSRCVLEGFDLLVVLVCVFFCVL